MEFAIREDEMVALDWAALRVVGTRAYDFHYSHSLKGSGELTLTLKINQPQEALVEETATNVYERIRRSAHLPVDDPPVILMVAVIRGLPREADEHIFEAQRLRDEQRYGTATVEAQTYFEMHVRELIEEVAEALGPVVLALTRAQRHWTLLDRGGEQLFTILFDSRPADFDCWNDYQAHVRRRNAIVHRGEPISHADAEASIEVVTRFKRHVTTLRGGALEPSRSSEMSRPE